jgi:hypothetical protein
MKVDRIERIFSGFNTFAKSGKSPVNPALFLTR